MGNWMNKVRNEFVAIWATSSERQALTYCKEELTKVDCAIQRVAQLDFFSKLLCSSDWFLPAFIGCRSVKTLNHRKFFLEGKVAEIEKRIIKSGLYKTGSVTLLTAGAAILAYHLADTNPSIARNSAQSVDASPCIEQQCECPDLEQPVITPIQIAICSLTAIGAIFSARTWCLSGGRREVN